MMKSAETNNELLEHRPIRSFVLRQGRLSPAQARAYESLMPRFGVLYNPSPLDLDALFGRTAPKILEIGFGMGATTATIAATQQDKDFLGLEVHTPGIGSLLNLIDKNELTNLRIIPHDAVETLQAMIGLETLNGVHIFFPDPWPKKRHHKRRLVQPEFIKLLTSRLKPGGYIHLATDWQDYAEQMLVVLSQASTLENTVKDYAPRPAYRPETKFERRGIDLGHGVWDLVFKKF